MCVWRKFFWEEISLKAPFSGAVWALKKFLAQNIPAVGRHWFAASLFANPTLPPQNQSQRESEMGGKGERQQWNDRERERGWEGETEGISREEHTSAE